MLLRTVSFIYYGCLLNLRCIKKTSSLYLTAFRTQHLFFFSKITLKCLSITMKCFTQCSMIISFDFGRFPMESSRFLVCIFCCFVTFLFSKCCSGQWFFIDMSLPHSVALVFAMDFSSFSTIVFSMKLRIDFRFDQQGIENGIAEHSKLENPSLLGHD